MSKFPVTNIQFRAFIDDGGYQEESWWEDIPAPDNKPHHQSSEGNRPVEGIGYYDAIAFCNWLSSQTGDDIRLPTEKQWEKAARGTDGRYYSWGNEYISNYANVNEVLYKERGDLLGRTSAVGIFPQAESPFHVLDMNGNVGEWCIRDNNEASIFSSVPSMDIGVTRGGSWLDDPETCRSTFRSILFTDFRHINQGLIVRPVQLKETPN